MKPTLETAAKILSLVKIEERANFAAYMTEVYGDDGKIYTDVMIDDKKRQDDRIRLQDPERILKVASVVFKVDPLDILSLSRKREFVDPRRMSMAMGMIYGAFGSLALCGQYHGGRDHATVLHAKRSHLALIEADRVYREHYHQFVNIIGADVH